MEAAGECALATPRRMGKSVLLRGGATRRREHFSASVHVSGPLSALRAAGRGGMFKAADHGAVVSAYAVPGTGAFAGRTAVLLGPQARARAEAYMCWLNDGAARQRRRTDPGFKGRADPER